MIDGKQSLIGDRAAIALIVLCVGVLFAPNLATRTYPVDPFWVELAFIHAPLKEMAKRSFSAGEFPLWYTGGHFGYPSMSHSHTYFFYPGAWVFYAASFMNTLVAFNLLHLILIGVTSYKLFKKIGADKEGALLCSIPMATGGYALANMGFMPVFATFAWTPLVLLLVIKVLEKRRIRHSIALAAATTMQCFAGDMEMMFYQWMVTLICVCLVWLYDEKKRPLLPKGTFLILACGVIGAFMAIVQLTMMFELFSQSDRIAGWALPSLRGRAAYVVGEYARWMSRIVLPLPAVAHYYNVGFVALAFGVNYLLRDRSWVRRFLLIMFAGLFICSVPYVSPMQRIFSDLPFLRGFRFPWRVLFLVELALCAAGALGVGKYFSSTDKPARWPGIALIFYSALALLIAYINEKPWQSAALVAALAVAAVAMYAADKIDRRVAFAIMLFVVVADLPVFNSQHLPRNPANAMTPYDEVYDFVAEMKSGPDKLARSITYATKLDGRFISGIEMTLDIYTPGFTSSLYIKRGSRFFDLMSPETFDFNAKTDALENVNPYYHYFLEHKFLTPEREKWYDLAGVKYILSDGQDPYVEDGSSTAERSFRKIRDGRISIYKNDDAFPRAFVVGNAIVKPTIAAVYETMRSTPEIDFRNTAMIESKTPVAATESASVTAEATTTKYGYNKIEVVATSSAAAWLVFTDSYFIGWRAFVNGIESRIYPADGAFRGVRVPAGRSEVIFRLMLVSFRLGLWATFSAIACAVGALVVSRRAAASAAS